jgi:hypothetical protein
LRQENCDLRAHNAHLQDDNTRLVHKQNELLLTITTLQEAHMKLQEAHIRRLESGQAAAAVLPAAPAASAASTAPAAPAAPATPAVTAAPAVPASTPSRKRKAAGSATRHYGDTPELHDRPDGLVLEFKQRLNAQTKQRQGGGVEPKFSSSTIRQYGQVLQYLTEVNAEGAEPVLCRRADLFAADFEARARLHLAPRCALAAATSAQRHGGVAKNSAEVRLTTHMTAIRHARDVMPGSRWIMQSGKAAVAAADTSEAVRASAHAPQLAADAGAATVAYGRAVSDCDEI